MHTMASGSPHQPSFTPIQQTQASPPGGPQGSPPTTGPDAKRRRITRACDLCKSRKRRCTGDVPCLSCIGSGARCTYLTSYNRGKTSAPPTSGLPTPAPSTYALGARETRGSVGNDTANALGNGAQASRWLDGPSEAKTERRASGDASRSGSPGAGEPSLDGQYMGPSSPYAFLRRAWKRLGPGSVDAEGLDLIYRQHRSSEQRPVLSYGDREPLSDPSDVSIPDAGRMQSWINRYFAFASPTYRFLHEPTLCRWHKEWSERFKAGEEPPQSSNRRDAAVFLVAAVALSSSTDGSDEDIPKSDSYDPQEGVATLFLAIAEQKLREEKGRPTLESVQARLAHCQYLLCTSRPGEAWYTLGTTIQMMMTLGIHRRGTNPKNGRDPIATECSKRAFWTAYLLDAYLSGMLGRPHLIHDDDVDQDFPAAVDDEQLTTEGLAKKTTHKDCSMTGAVMHAKLAVVIKRASREQTSIAKSTDTQKVENAVRLAGQLAEWQKSLPVILSGAIHPSTLVPFFRRQVTILHIAKAHATMLIHRFAILSDPRQLPGIEMHIDECLNAALVCLDMIVEMAAEKHMFAAFWNTHFVTFSALTIVYIWLIQHKIGRLPSSDAVPDIEDLSKQAEIVRHHLREATSDSAPSLRYSIILEELSQEVQRCVERVPADRASEKKNASEKPFDPSGSLLAGMDDQQPADDSLPTPLDLETTFEFPIDSDLWLQLDAFPFCE